MTTATEASESKKNNGSKTAFEGQSRFSGWKFLPEDLVIIGLDTKDGPEHPLYDERVAGPHAIKMDSPEMEARINNIMRHGTIRGVAIVKDGDRALVEDGRQTVRAAREANKRLKKAGQPPVKILCMPPSEGDDKEHIGRMLAGNTYIVDPPMARATKLGRLINRGMEFAEIGQEMGLSHQTVRNIVSLLQLTPELQSAVNVGEITESVGYELAKLPKGQQKSAWEEMQKSGNLTVTAAKVAAHNAKAGAPSPEDGEEEEGDDGEKPTRKPKRKPAETRYVPPGLRVIKKLLKGMEEGSIDADHFAPDVVKVFKWFVGEGSARSVNGLSPALRVIGETPDE